jgi:hypothetical protein
MIQAQAGMASIYQGKQQATRPATQLEQRITSLVSQLHPEG